MAQGQTLMAGSPAGDCWLSQRRELHFLCKRLLDLAIAVPALLFLAPVLVFIGLLIMIDSKGSPIFAQTRAGSKRRRAGAGDLWEITPFTIYKFRTMYQNCDQSLHQAFIKSFAAGDVDAGSDQGAEFKLNDDPRITRAGHFLRRASLDELPQLLNVVKGDMSLVGPRPVPEYEAEYYTGEQIERLYAVPGITGLWQVQGRSQVTFAEMARMDIAYARNQSLWLDLKILMLTIPSVFTGSGAR